LLNEYLALQASRLTQASERLFVEDFLFPILVLRSRRFNLSICSSTERADPEESTSPIAGLRQQLALEVNGETYHAAGIIPNEMFGDNLFRQNEILRRGYDLIWFSYSQLRGSGAPSLPKVGGRFSRGFRA
jgi:hypothetical protein